MTMVSIIIPTFNEEKTLKKIVEKTLENKKYNLEIIIIDDGSTDGTKEIINKNFLNNSKVKIIFNKKNYGKGYSVNQGVKIASGDIVLIQDADLEYNPSEHYRLIDPIANNFADVVYGSRFVGNDPHRVIYFLNRIANSFLTMLTNILTNLNLTDMETGFKAIKKIHLSEINIKENGFGVEPEITVKLSKKNLRFYEVGISYFGRTYEEGKKIRAKHFFEAIFVLIKYRFF